MGSVLRELEELRTLLDQSPSKIYHPFTTLSLSTNVSTPKATKPGYAAALSTAERSVDRLGKAIEMAEEEMDAALRRTTEVHKSQLRQREVELAEAQRVLGAKERSIDSLRDTLAATKRAYEGRVSQAEGALALKEAEVIALQEEVRAARREREAVEVSLSKKVAMLEHELAAVREREAEVAAVARSRGEEAAKAMSALRGERVESDRAAAREGELRRQVEVLGDELRVLRVESRADKERLEGEVVELARRLRAERSVRKACEKWLRSELRSREEMEVLLAAIKDAAAGKAGSGVDLDDVEALLDGLRGKAGAAAALHSPASPAAAAAASAVAAYTSHASVLDLEGRSRKVQDDSRRLKEELAAARKLLRERLLH